MNDPLLTVASISLVALGVAAEWNLARVFISDWRAERRERQRRLLQAAHHVATKDSPPRGRTGCCAIGIATAALIFAPAAAHAQQASPSIAAPPTPPTPPAPVATPEAAPAAPPPDLTPPPDALVISADRPGFSETTSIVPTGHLQIETGYTFTFRNRDDVETQRSNAPELLARFGLLSDRLEIRLSTAGYVWSRTDDGSGSGFVSSEGFSDLALGMKLKVTDQDGWLPRLAVDVTTTLGTGSDNISTQSVEPALKLLWSYDLGQSFGDDWKGVTLGGNAILAWPTSDGDHFTQGQLSAYLSFPIADRLSGFVEYFVITPNTKDADPANYIDFGGAYLLNNRVQLDARVGFGLNDEADNLFVGVGLSVLF